MLRHLAITAYVFALAGCSALGYYKRPHAERAPEAEAAKASWPESSEGGTELDGPAVAALEVAMNDYLPLGKRIRMTDGYKPLEDCLSRRDTYDVLVKPYGDNWFYVSFLPRLERCNLENVLLDAGAEYVIDRKGRILLVR